MSKLCKCGQPAIPDHTLCHEHFLVEKRRYYQAHKDAIKASQRKYAEAHKDKIKALNREYAKKHYNKEHKFVAYKAPISGKEFYGQVTKELGIAQPPDNCRCCGEPFPTGKRLYQSICPGCKSSWWRGYEPKTILEVTIG